MALVPADYRKLLGAEARRGHAVMQLGRIAHDGDPVLAWMLGNVVGHYDAKENVCPRKEWPENKIDGAIALIMALCRHMVVGDAPSLDDFLNNPIIV
jgi:phage terminase large subunit-like protein